MLLLRNLFAHLHLLSNLHFNWLPTMWHRYQSLFRRVVLYFKTFMWGVHSRFWTTTLNFLMMFLLRQISCMMVLAFYHFVKVESSIKGLHFTLALEYVRLFFLLRKHAIYFLKSIFSGRVLNFVTFIIKIV